LRLVDRATLSQVIEEFANELDAVGFSSRGGLADALKLLDGKITPQTAKNCAKTQVCDCLRIHGIASKGWTLTN